MRISRRKTPAAIIIRAARERRYARIFKQEALIRLYTHPYTKNYAMLQIELRFRKFYKGPYAHPDR